MYSIFHCTKKQRLMLKSCIPRIELWMGPKRYYNNHFYENIVDELNYWIFKYPYIVSPSNVSDSVCVKINVNL